MSRSSVVRILKLSVVLVILCAAGPVSAQAAKKAPQFTDDFRLQDCTFSSVGENPYFIVQPGYQTVFKGLEDGVAVVNTITVLNKTLELGGVETRVIEERETHDGQLAEVSLNYFAVCTETNSVFYFGEDVDIYEGGVIVGHEGSWHHGVDGARAGLVMPGIVLLGSRYAQEVAPGVAMDRAEFVGMHETLTTPAGTFTDCIRSAETTPLEPRALEYKLYSAGIGLVQDDTLLLESAGFIHLR